MFSNLLLDLSQNRVALFDRPCVAGAVLQTPK